MTSLLHSAPGLSEGFLGDLVQMFSAQAKVVALVGAQHLLEDVLVIGRVPLGLGTVDETLDLKGGRARDQENITFTLNYTVIQNSVVLYGVYFDSSLCAFTCTGFILWKPVFLLYRNAQKNNYDYNH